MDFTHFFDLILHIDRYLGEVIRNYGALVYVLIGAIVFCETGFVVLFFLPGDTMLFIGGAFCASGAISVWVLIGLLVVAAISGSTLNYWIGSFIGHKAFTGHYRWLDRDALAKTHSFYEKYGGITMVLSRFIPVVRSFAPFVAGMSEMTFRKFQIYNISGAALWATLLVFAGYFFGNLPIFHDHLNTIVLIGVGVAVVPVAAGSLWRFGKKFLRR
jgi:membrane-associated protein